MIQIKRYIVLLSYLLSVIVIAGCTLSLREYISEADQIPCVSSEGDTTDNYSAPSPMDAEAYYSESGTILNVIDVMNSAAIHTEAEAFTSFVARGFSQNPVTSDFTIEGEVQSEYVISEQSKEKHPLYTSYFISDEGIFWTILDMNGRFFAYPVSYSLASTDNIQIIVSESNSLISFDGVGNRYYETIPNTDVIKIIQVNHIDAETMNQFTIEELKKQ